MATQKQTLARLNREYKGAKGKSEINRHGKAVRLSPAEWMYYIHRKDGATSELSLKPGEGKVLRESLRKKGFYAPKKRKKKRNNFLW